MDYQFDEDLVSEMASRFGLDDVDIELMKYKGLFPKISLRKLAELVGISQREARQRVRAVKWGIAFHHCHPSPEARRARSARIMDGLRARAVEVMSERKKN